MGGAIIIALFLLVYFIPAIVAVTRDHPQGLAIFMLNLSLADSNRLGHCHRLGLHGGSEAAYP